MSEFNRGLEQGIEFGAMEERQRIIALLEAAKPHRETYQMPMEYWVERKLVKHLIALIKGEN